MVVGGLRRGPRFGAAPGSRRPPVDRFLAYIPGRTRFRPGDDDGASGRSYDPPVSGFVSRWIRPVATAAVVELIAVAGTALGPTRRGRPADALAIALVVVAAAMVAIARRWPLPALLVSFAATLAYYALGYGTDSSFFVGLLATAYLSATAGARLRTAVFALAIPAAFLAASQLGLASDRAGALPFSVIVVGGLIAGQAAAEYRARAERRTERAREEEALRRLAEERLRIARELHDVVSHSIAMINVQSSAALHVMEERPGQAREALLAIKSASHDALRDLRGILGLLHQADDEEPRGPAAGLSEVGTLVDSVRRAGLQVAMEMDGDGGRLPSAIDLAAYRVVQEALTNVVRHAPGAAATVAVHRKPDLLLVEVRDDGRSEPQAAGGRQGAGRGLAGMRERVQAAGGVLEAGPRPGGGFTVRARLPLLSGCCSPTIRRSCAPISASSLRAPPTSRSSARRPTARRRLRWPVGGGRTSS